MIAAAIRSSGTSHPRFLSTVPTADRNRIRRSFLVEEPNV